MKQQRSIMAVVTIIAFFVTVLFLTSFSVKIVCSSDVAVCEGDFDNDGDVDGADLAIFAADFGRTDCLTGAPCEGDFAKDGDVDGSDLAIFADDFGRTDCPSQASTYYVAPTEQGTGEGTSLADAADYLDATFWADINDLLKSQAVTVYFADGTYNRGGLSLKYYGNSDNLLYLRGIHSGNEVQFTSNAKVLLDLTATRNIKVRDLNFSGTGCKEHAIQVLSKKNYPCRDIDIFSCRFTNLTDATYGGVVIGPEDNSDYGGPTNITVRNCLFDTIGKDGKAHAVYFLWDCNNIDIHGNTFEDISGGYLIFRDNICNVNVYNNIFRSTGTFANEHSTVAISIHNGNTDSDDHEIFGHGYAIHENTFDFADGSMMCRPIYWSHLGHEEGGFNQILSSGEASMLKNGGPNAKQTILRKAGVDTNAYINGNTYNSNVLYRISYKWNDMKGNEGERDIYNVFFQIRFSSNWNHGIQELEDWTVSEHPPETNIYITTSNPIEGTHSCCLRDSSASYRPDLYRSVGTDITRGYYRTWIRINSSTGNIYPIYTNLNQPTIYWIMAKSITHKWGNDRITFTNSPTWTTGTNYFLEMEFDFTTDKYTVWLNDAKIADNITIPTSNTSMSGNLYISPSELSTRGNITIDFTKLGVYEP